MFPRLLNDRCLVQGLVGLQGSASWSGGTFWKQGEAAASGLTPPGPCSRQLSVAVWPAGLLHLEDSG